MTTAAPTTPFIGPPPELGPKATETRRRLLDAARELFVEGGYAEATVGRIVERAGVSRPTFYTYFDDRKEIIVALAYEMARDFHGAALGPLLDDRATRTTESVIRRRVADYLRAYRDNYGLVRAWMEAAAIHPEIGAARRRIQDSLMEGMAALLGQEQARGAMDAEVDTLVVATALVQMTETFATQWMARGRELDEHVSEQLTQLWMRALYGKV